MAATLNSAGIVYSDGTIAYSTGYGGVGCYVFGYLNTYTTPGTNRAASYWNFGSGFGSLGGTYRLMGVNFYESTSGQYLAVAVRVA